jgi:hypothetical protein
MKHYHFFHAETGLFHQRRFSTDDAAAIKNNTPIGYVAIEGVFDPLSQRMQITTDGFVLTEYQPPQPSPDHQWNADAKRWLVKPDIAARKARRMSVLAQIYALEHGPQPRAIREMLLDKPGALDRLRALDEQISTLRAQIN